MIRVEKVEIAPCALQAPHTHITPLSDGIETFAVGENARRERRPGHAEAPSYGVTSLEKGIELGHGGKMCGIFPASSSRTLPAFRGAGPASIMRPMAIADRITERMEALDLNPNSTAIKAGLPRDAVRDILSGKSKNPRADTLAKLSRALECDPAFLLDIPALRPKPQPSPTDAGEWELPIRFEVAAGAWMAVDEMHDQPLGHRPASRIKPFEDFPQWLEQVRGDSINKLIPDGGFAHVVDAIALHYAPRQDDLVVVVRTRAQGAFIERTVKQVDLRSGELELWPRSHSPQWSSPLRPIEGMEGDDEATVIIAGLVIRGYMPFMGTD